MRLKIPENLRPIYDLEISLGNHVVQFRESAGWACLMAVFFMRQLHRSEIELQIQLAPAIRWHSMGKFSGFFSEDTLESIQGPTPTMAEVIWNAKQTLSKNLQPIYDLEIALGNTVESVDEPAGDRCPLAINFKHPMHKAEVEAALTMPSVVKWWECRDTHYPVQGGYACDDTSHVIAGPLRT